MNFKFTMKMAIFDQEISDAFETRLKTGFSFDDFYIHILTKSYSSDNPFISVIQNLNDV